MNTIIYFLTTIFVVFGFWHLEGASFSFSVPLRYAEIPSHHRTIPPDDLGIVVSTVLISQKRIDGDNDVYGEQLTLKVRFMNSSERDYLIRKDLVIPKYSVSKSPEKALSGQNELSVALTDVSSEETGPEKLTNNEFVLLEKGESYETCELITIFVSKDPFAPVSGTITSGRHVLQLTINPWPWTELDKKKLKGIPSEKVWTKLIISEPMSFVAE